MNGAQLRASHRDARNIRGLLHNARPLRLRRLLYFCRRDHERGPEVPAVRAMCGVEFLVALEVHVALIVIADLEDVADLRPHTDDPRFKAADPVATPAVARDLIVKVSDKADLPFLGDEL